MDFLVEITVTWPPDGDPAQRDRLVIAEGARARELAELGRIKRLWRRPGAWANIGIWSAADATELHDALASLPFYPWLQIEITPLADHPYDPARNGGSS